MLRYLSALRQVLRWLARFFKQVCASPKVLFRVLCVLGSCYQGCIYPKLPDDQKPEHYTICPSLAPPIQSPPPGSDASLSSRHSQSSTVPHTVNNNASATIVSQSGLAQTSRPTRAQRGDTTRLTIRPGARSQTPSQLNQAPWEIVPALASDVMNKRYDRIRYARKYRAMVTIEAGCTSFKDDDQAVWTSYVHPEGALYFVRSGDSHDGICTTFTNADVRVSKGRVDICSELDKATKQIFERAIANNVSIDANSDLVLDPDVKNHTVGYYIVNHQERCLVWVEDFKDMDFRIAEEIRGVENKGHIKHAMEAQYWAHCEAYPHDQKLTEGMFNELTDMVLHAVAERVTSDTSLAPYDADELDKIQGVLDSMKDRVGQVSPHGVCTVARFMRMFARSKFYNFCGQPEARLDADASVYRPSKHSKDNAHPPRSMLFFLVAIPMFGVPQSQLTTIEGVWVDRSINTARWKEYLQNSYDEFTGFALYSTVMLAVNVSYLAVPGVGHDSPGSENAATVFTYISIIAVVGSMTLSLLLSADARRRKTQSAEIAAGLLSTVCDSLFGIETLAIMYSLPFALLMWGMVGFLGGLCARIFPGAALYTIYICAVALGMLGLAVWIPLYTWWRVEHGTPKAFELLGYAFEWLFHALECRPCRRRARADRRTTKEKRQPDPEQGGAVAGQGQGTGRGQLGGQGQNYELQDRSQQSQTQAQALGSQEQPGSGAMVPMPATQLQPQVVVQDVPSTV